MHGFLGQNRDIHNTAQFMSYVRCSRFHQLYGFLICSMKYPLWAIALMLIIGVPILAGIVAAAVAVPEILIVVLGGAVYGVLMTTKQIKTKWDKPNSRFNHQTSKRVTTRTIPIWMGLVKRDATAFEGRY